jgi:DNA invertase Pin-like site-specific DNA recombinase
MPSISGPVDQTASFLKEQIAELERELARLQRALASLTDGREGRRGPGRPRGTARTVRRRRRRGGTRADQAVKIIADNPGVTASEIAKQMRIKPNYLYRVLGDLQKDGRVKKSGRSYSLAA